MATTIIDDSNIRDFVNLYVDGNKEQLPEDLRKKSIGKWDVSRVTDMSKLFMDAEKFNESLNEWDVSNVTDMHMMFFAALKFNQPLNKWGDKLSKVTDMSSMFDEAESFNRPLYKWNVSNVTNMSSMFAYAENFNQPLHNWNVSNVENMSSMFNSAEKFNQPLNKWGNKLSKVENMSSMFSRATTFNQPLNTWNVSNVKDMRSMFSHAKNFKQPLNSWIISNDTETLAMFDGASDFYDDESNRPTEETYETLRNKQIEDQKKAVKRAIDAAEAAARNAPISPYDECIICGDPLDNNKGPGPTPKCRENCNDVVKVCEKNHMFHRGCILEACNAESVDIAAQMGVNQYSTIRAQQRRNNCPLCQQPLLIDCNDFNNIELGPKIPDDKLPLQIRGGKTRSNRRKLSNRKSKKQNNKNCKNTAKSKRKNKNNTKRK